MIVCAAFIGQTNNPLLIRTFEPLNDDLLKYHYTVHCALDAIEEKLLLKRGPGELLDLYLGILYPTEDYKVYGYVTNTHIKIVLLLDDEQPIKDEQLQKVFKRLHALYVDTVSNPFHSMGLPIRSPRFEAALEQVVTTYPKPAGSIGGFQS